MRVVVQSLITNWTLSVSQYPDGTAPGAEDDKAVEGFEKSAGKAAQNRCHCICKVASDGDVSYLHWKMLLFCSR